MRSAHSTRGARSFAANPKRAAVTRAMKPQHEGAAGSQNFWPLRSASNCARQSGRWKALWWWSNHQSRRGDGEYRKSTTAFTSASKASGGNGSPSWCCTGWRSMRVSRDPSRASKKRPRKAAEAHPSKQLAW